MVPGCGDHPTHVLSLRMRRRDTGADWAPNLPAFFCTPHATDGAKLTILYEPRADGHVEVEVVAAHTAVTRTVEIRRRGGVLL